MPKKTPRLTPRILRVLIDCFNAAEAGGFSGDTQGLTNSDTEAAEKWLDAWGDKFAKQLKKLDEEAEALAELGENEEEEEDEYEEDEDEDD